MAKKNNIEFTHVHLPSKQKVKLKKDYGSISVIYVEPYPISIVWGKKEYCNTIICKNEDLIPI
jgi:hypothetical protein